MRKKEKNVTIESLFTIRQNNKKDLRTTKSLSDVTNAVQILLQNTVKRYKESTGVPLTTTIYVVNIEKISIEFCIKCIYHADNTEGIEQFSLYLHNEINALVKKEENSKCSSPILLDIEKLRKKGIQEITYEFDNKSTTWRIKEKHLQITPHEDKSMSEKIKKIEKGLKHLHKIMDKINSIVKNTSEKHNLYQNPKFVFRGITKFYPDTNVDEKKPELYNVEHDNIKSSLAVRLRDTSKDYLNDKNYTRAFYVNVLEDIIRKAKNMYPNKYLSDMSDLDILADIQHNGGATCLVDFSKNLLTSIWFACNADSDADGYIYCYNIMEDMIERDTLTVIRPEDENRKISELIAQTYRETNVCSDVDIRFCLWEPSKRNNRMFRQDSVFVFGIEKFKVEDHAINVIQIKADWKSDILTAMKAIFNISGTSVYNDHIGFANNMNKQRPYRKMLDSVYTRGYENMIKGHYASALEFLKLAEIECQEEGWDDKRKLELHFSLGVCYKSLARQNEKIHYFEIAILEYRKVIKLTKKIVSENTEEIEYYHHKMIRSYNAIVTLYYKLGRYCDAIKTCEEIIDVIAQWKENNPKTSKETTSNYCEISILELLDLDLIKQNSTKKEWCDYFVKMSKKYNIDQPISYKDNPPIDFFVLLKEYYKEVAKIANPITNERGKSIEEIISSWNSRSEIYFKNQVTSKTHSKTKYILWNFTDMKNAIDEIKENHYLFSHKAALQDLTAGVISLRDQYEMNGWWSEDQV